MLEFMNINLFVHSPNQHQHAWQQTANVKLFADFFVIGNLQFRFVRKRAPPACFFNAHKAFEHILVR